MTLKRYIPSVVAVATSVVLWSAVDMEFLWTSQNYSECAKTKRIEAIPIDNFGELDQHRKAAEEAREFENSAHFYRSFYETIGPVGWFDRQNKKETQ